jgi:hypothetical protein
LAADSTTVPAPPTMTPAPLWSAMTSAIVRVCFAGGAKVIVWLPWRKMPLP